LPVTTHCDSGDSDATLEDEVEEGLTSHQTHYRSYRGNATLDQNVTSVTVTHAKSRNNKNVIITTLPSMITGLHQLLYCTVFTANLYIFSPPGNNSIL